MINRGLFAFSKDFVEAPIKLALVCTACTDTDLHALVNNNMHMFTE